MFRQAAGVEAKQEFPGLVRGLVHLLPHAEAPATCTARGSGRRAPAHPPRVRATWARSKQVHVDQFGVGMAPKRRCNAPASRSSSTRRAPR
jgi:hypothetical protein